jgi:hypothetical protein
LRATFPDGNEVDFLLHSARAVRIRKRDRGISDAPRKFNGAIEAPTELVAQLAELQIGAGNGFDAIWLIPTAMGIESGY